MTDKVIIDGVDVSGCSLCDDSIEHICRCKASPIFLASEVMDYYECKEISNCYYKQLARKTEECESLKKELELANIQLESYFIGEPKLIQQLQASQQKVADYKQALEEIKEYIDKQCLKCINSTLDNEYCVEERCSLWEILQICNEVLNEQ